MSGKRSSDDETQGPRLDGSVRTLGELLFANKTDAETSEREWAILVGAIGAGDQAALRALYDRSHRLVFTLCARIVGSRETAEELTLDVFHDVWRRAAKYDPADGTVLGWIMNQARSRAIDRIRFEQRKKRVAPQTMENHETEEDSSRLLEMDHQAQVLRSVLTVLSPLERQAIETAFFAELTYAEVATRLNEPVGTIKTRIRSGLQKLRQALAGLDAAEVGE